MAKKDEILYVVDEKGKKKWVLISYRAFLKILDDFNDLRSKDNEKPLSLEDFLEKLRNSEKKARK